MEEKTRLQQIVGQKAEQVRNAIEQAIDEGAIIKDKNNLFATIDDVFLQRNNSSNSFAVVLHFDSEKIAKVFEPSKDELQKIAEQKRSELEKIEKKINEYETYND